MRKALTLLLFLATTSVSAQMLTDINTLKKYATEALARCPDQNVTIQEMSETGPAGFLVYTVTQTSSDATCGRQTYLLYSPRSRTVLLGNAFALPVDGRPVEVRVAERTTEVLQHPTKATVSKFPLPDGLKAVTILRDSKYGPFGYHGFVDASERYLIVGTRGNVSVNPGETLLDSIGIKHAVRRGNPKAKAQIVELSDFECPTCGRAHKTVEPLIEKNLSKVDYYRLDLPLFEHHEWAFDAAMGARAISKVAPNKYWAYDNFVFANQEPISKQKFDTVLKNFCDDNDISWAAVQKIYKSPAERTALLDQVSRMFDSGITSTPTYIVNGQVMGYGPEGTYTINAIKRALGVK